MTEWKTTMRAMGSVQAKRRILLGISLTLGVVSGLSFSQWSRVAAAFEAPSGGDLVQARNAPSGTREKLIVASGEVAMELSLNAEAKPTRLRFDTERDAFFTLTTFNDELRGPMPGSSMGLLPQRSAYLPARLANSYNQLVIEALPFGEQYELAVRDGKTGFLFFNIEGNVYEYDADSREMSVRGARLLLSPEFASELGRSDEAAKVVGNITINVKMRAIEITQIVEGETIRAVLPAGSGMDNDNGTVPGPDVIVGDVNGLAQFGVTGTTVGLALGTDSCNAGVVDLDWFQLPSNNHPVIPQNMYRMSGGTGNDERFEQIGQSSVKHAFFALQENICGYGCNGVGGTRLGSGCSDPYEASLNAGPQLGSKAWINPFTGEFPRGDSATNPNNHTGHTGDSNAGHRIRTEMADLNTTLNPGATYYAEGQYVTPHEYVWCQANPGQCNMNNNVSYRRFNVFGTTSFSFTEVGATQRQKAAIEAWTGSTRVMIQPDPLADGIGTLAYKVTNPSAGVWHYEYAIYNQNLDRGIQSFSVPVGSASLSNIGFHAPPQHPGTLNDGTVGSAGFSSAAWAPSQSGGAMTWSSETFAQNPNANAIRWSTLYNFRFDSSSPPQTVQATIGFYKSGAPITLAVQAPAGGGTPTPTNTPTATPTNTPTATPTNTPTATPTNTPTATPTNTPTATPTNTPTATPTNTPTATPTNTPTATPTATPEGFEGDIAPRPNGDGSILSTDVTQIRRFATGLDTVNPATNELQRADSAPRASGGDGILNSGDVVQVRRYAAGLDPLTNAGGPTVAADGQLRAVIGGSIFGEKLYQLNQLRLVRGKDGSVAAEFESLRDVAAVSFRLKYDATKLGKPNVALGDLPEGSVLTVNDTVEGELTVLIDSARGFGGVPESLRLVEISFAKSPAEGLVIFDGAVSVSDLFGNDVRDLLLSEEADTL